MNIAFFGSSLVSAYWNGAATYYRGILRALHRRGHTITFYEPNAYERQQHRDIPDPDYARVVVYDATEQDVRRSVEAAAGSDVVVKASGVGVFDEYLEQAVLAHHGGRAQVIFWDVDAPATLDRLAADASDPFHECVPRYDLIFTYGGGTPVIERYTAFGAQACLPIYNALDPDSHYPVAPDSRFSGDLAFMGNRLPDREARVQEFFIEPARTLPGKRFLLGGNGWLQAQLPENITVFGHMYTRDHNAFNCTPRAILNVSRDSMARCGYSPATRVFEAAGAGACMITDAWDGVEQFFAPESEWLIARDGRDVADLTANLDTDAARRIGAAARARVLRDHTYAQRAKQVEDALLGRVLQ